MVRPSTAWVGMALAVGALPLPSWLGGHVTWCPPPLVPTSMLRVDSTLVEYTWQLQLKTHLVSHSKCQLNDADESVVRTQPPFS